MCISNQFTQKRNSSGAMIVTKILLLKETLIESVHEEKSPFKFFDCDKAFCCKGNMNGHIESVHEGKKPFKI